MRSEFLDLLGDEHAMSVLAALRAEGTLRFNALQGALDANPNQVNRALKKLQQGLYVLAETLPTEGERLYVHYRLAKRGQAFLEAFDALVAKARQKRSVLGEDAVREIEAFAS